MILVMLREGIERWRNLYTTAGGNCELRLVFSMSFRYPPLRHIAG